MQVAANQLYEAFLLDWQMYASYFTPTLHPQSELFCQRFLGCIWERNSPWSEFMWLPVDQKRQQATLAPSKTDE